MTELQMIKAAADERGITRLCHFTTSANLLSILVNGQGLLSSDQLGSKRPDIFDPTDRARLDGRKGHICCSVEFPNPAYFRRAAARGVKHFPDWAVVLLSPSLIWRAGTLFSPCNAATANGAHIREGLNGFQRLFDKQVVGANNRVVWRSATLPSFCPTDYQAEVLVEGSVPWNDILGIVVPTEKQAFEESIRWSVVPDIKPVPIIVAPDLFSDRWAQLVRAGQRPQENVYGS